MLQRFKLKSGSTEDADNELMNETLKQFLGRLERIIPAQHWEEAIASFQGAKPTTARLNPLRGEVAETLAGLANVAIPCNPVGWYQDWSRSLGCETVAIEILPEYREKLTHSPLVDSGAIYVQSLSSMLAPPILGAEPGETVLDLAAAPGGKTTHLAALMNNRGVLSAVEPIRDRLFKLKHNLDRCGVTCVKTYPIDGRLVGKKTPARFDRVLLDAPCSSDSRVHFDEPESYEYWSERKIKEQSRKQRGLVSAAFQALKQGGVLLYCTCSTAPEENEAVVEDLLSRYPGEAEIEAIDLPLSNLQSGLDAWDGESFSESMQRTVRILPTTRMDAFYLAKIRRK